jgi:uncharacterized membrane protein YhaH (DUF805 family)
MHWYTDALRKYATFSGRARRMEYWMFVLIYGLITFAIEYGERYIGTGGIIGIIFSLGMIIPSLAVAVRRLHDTNHSGWWLLAAPVPLLDLVLLYYFLTRGDPGPNSHGPDPKAAVVAA